MITTIRADKKTMILIVVASLLATFAAACGSDSGAAGGEAGVARVVANDRIYTVEDIKVLRPSGVKSLKEYDVEELPGALAAMHALYNQFEYEARYYATHEDAVAQGTLYADSVTGDDAVVTGNEILWEEGAKDRRMCSRASGTPHSGCDYSGRYLEYVIRGNMILFCEGNDSEQAFANCEELLALIDPA
jgi:hypothetical protein